MMTQDEIVALFRREAGRMKEPLSEQNDLILQLAQLLADSRGRLSKENFDTLVYIGAALYKEGDSRFHARSDMGALMARTADSAAPE
jgi:hypothetical protein